LAQDNETLSDSRDDAVFPLPRDSADNCTREQTRRLTTLRVGTITISGKRELCLIRNVSAGGLRAHVYTALEEGQLVSVELKTNQQTHGRVSWVDGGTVGIAFDREIDIAELLTVPSDGVQPRMPRVAADSLGELRIGARVYPINTCDISQGGAGIEIDHPLAIGENVVLTLEKLRPVAGVVRWYDNGQGGIRFNQVLPLHELVHWLRKH
jgi:hypothetical protein